MPDLAALGHSTEGIAHATQVGRDFKSEAHTTAGHVHAGCGGRGLAGKRLGYRSVEPLPGYQRSQMHDRFVDWDHDALSGGWADGLRIS
jgi:hypothetical protein